MKVTSTQSIRFPKLDWGISVGEEKDLPTDKAAQERILAEPCISIVGEGKKNETVERKNKNEKEKDN